MPLHLLPKKSWNVYAPQNVARVKADEAAAAADEEKHEQDLRDYEAQVRVARLRGESPPRPPPEQDVAFARVEKRRRLDGALGEQTSDGKKKRRRLQGEDDTDRDIRLARDDESYRAGRSKAHPDVLRRQQQQQQQQHKGISAAPLLDHKGNIQLFAPPSTCQIHAENSRALENERKQRKGAEGTQDRGMRLTDAAGSGRPRGSLPWYASEKGYSGTQELVEGQRDGSAPGTPSVEGKDAFGRDDPLRPKRDAARLLAADPMAAMNRAQGQLKNAERKREETRREREKDLRDLQEEQELEERMRRRRRRDRREGVRRRSDGLSRRGHDNPLARPTMQAAE